MFLSLKKLKLVETLISTTEGKYITNSTNIINPENLHNCKNRFTFCICCNPQQ